MFFSRRNKGNGGGDTTKSTAKVKHSASFKVDSFLPDGRLYAALSEGWGEKVWSTEQESEWMNILWLSFFAMDDAALGPYIPDGVRLRQHL